MKKLIVLLLTIAMVGAVSAQVTTSVKLSGGVTLVDQAGKAIFARDGKGTETLTFKAAEKDGKYGFSITYPDVLALDATAVSGWNVYYVGDYVKYTLGYKLSNSTFRASLDQYSKTSFGRLSGISDANGIFLQSTTLGDLIVGAFFPVTTAGVTTAGGPTLDLLKGADAGVKYTIKDIGFAQAYLNLATGANKVGVGFTYNAIKGLTVAAISEIEAKKYSFGASANYGGIDKLTIHLQACDVYATTNSFEVYGQADYALLDNVSATGWGSFVSTGNVMSVGACVDYSFANGLTLEGNGSYDFSTSTLGADLSVYYGVSF
jgi:hypothetical protein